MVFLFIKMLSRVPTRLRSSLMFQIFQNSPALHTLPSFNPKQPSSLLPALTSQDTEPGNHTTSLEATLLNDFNYPEHSQNTRNQPNPHTSRTESRTQNKVRFRWLHSRGVPTYPSVAFERPTKIFFLLESEKKTFQVEQSVLNTNSWKITLQFLSFNGGRGPHQS